MSYNTRRAGGGRGTPQVNYHQAPPSNARGGGRQSNQPGANPGYTSTQGYSSLPAYSTQSGYTSVQSKQPQQQQQQQQQAAAGGGTTPRSPATQPPQVPNSVQSSLQQQKQQLLNNVSAPPPPPSTAPPSTPPASSAQQQAVSLKMEEDVQTPDAETNGEGKKRPFWSRKGPLYKVSKKIKRRRQNARLRRILIPKNALMVLNELHPGMKFSVQEQTNALNQCVYTVSLDVEGKIHVGQAMSKVQAKQIACENALKSLLLTKMENAVSEINDQGMDTSEGGGLDSSQKSDSEKTSAGGGDGESADGSTPKPPPPEDDVPWGSLASFALHKLFLEWQNQGIEVPMAPRAITHNFMIKKQQQQQQQQVNAGAPGTPHPMKKIPTDAARLNPVQMLNQLQPRCQYQEKRDGSNPNFTFTISVNIDGQEYVGVSTNKREAKKECAKNALVKFGIISEYV